MKKLTYGDPVAASLVVLLLAAVWSVTATAQDSENNGRPSLYGHGFTETVDVPSPFVRTYIRNRLGAGKAFDLKKTVTDIAGEPVFGFQGDLIFAVLDFEYQYAIKDWIALRAKLVGAGRLGDNTMSLLSEGITMSTGFEVGWLVRLHERERTALSLDINISDRTFTGVSITRFVEDVVAGDPASLVRKTPSARTGIGLRYAWTASPLLGFIANGITGYGESVERAADNEWYWRLSGAFDFDLRTKLDFPMGVALGYSYDTFPEFGDNVAEGVHAMLVRFAYLGRDDFLLSLDLSFDRIPTTTQQGVVKGGTVTVSLRYYI